MVSVLVATRNRAGFLRELMESLLRQTYPRWELFIVDNASDDETPGLVRRYQESHGAKFAYKRLSENRGYTEGVDVASRLCHGALLCFVGDDDLLMPEMLETAARALIENQELGLVYTNVWVGEKPFGATYFPPDHRGIDDRTILIEECLERMSRHGVICTQGAVFRRDVFEAVGGFDVRQRYYQDVDLWARLTTRHKARYIPKILAFNRRHGLNLTIQEHEKFAQAAIDYWQAWHDRTQDHDVRRAIRNYLSVQEIHNGYFHLERGRFDFAAFRSHFRRAFGYRKFHLKFMVNYYLLISLLPELIAVRAPEILYHPLKVLRKLFFLNAGEE